MESKITVNPQIIMGWALERGGRPSRVKGTAREQDPGVIRIDFDEPDESLEEISWEDFINAFLKKHLAFVYQEETCNGELSKFNKLILRDDE